MKTAQFGILIIVMTSEATGLASLASPPKLSKKQDEEKKMISKIKAICRLFPKVCKHKQPKQLEVIIKDGSSDKGDVEIDVVERGSGNQRTILYHLKRVKLSLLKSKMKQKLWK